MKIKTERLTLRTMEQWDLEWILDMLKNDEIKKTYMIPDFPSEEAAVKLAQRFITLSQEGKTLIVGIVLGERLIGFMNEQEAVGGCIEMGYAIHPDCHGKGYMTEAFSAMIEALWGMRYTEITAGAFAENAASIRVMEKCGMKRIEKKEIIEYRGRMHECVYYAIEKTEEKA